jgi:hypothetical protein
VMSVERYANARLLKHYAADRVRQRLSAARVDPYAISPFEVIATALGRDPNFLGRRVTIDDDLALARTRFDARNFQHALIEFDIVRSVGGVDGFNDLLEQRIGDFIKLGG